MFERTVNPGSTWQKVDGEWLQLTEGVVPPVRPPFTPENPGPDWLTQLLGQHQGVYGYEGNYIYCECNDSRYDPDGPQDEDDHDVHLSALIWAEMERRMDQSGRSVNDPVYGFVEYD